MNKFFLSLVCLMALPLSSAAQKSIPNLPPAQAFTLREFLSARPGLKFLSEEKIDKEYLQLMRRNLGRRLTPYYRSGDFNHDSRQDFAMILIKDAPPQVNPGLADSHRDRYEMSVVIFNGTKNGTYQAAFVKTTMAPLVCFLGSTGKKREMLFFGVSETDEGFTMRPMGDGYIAEDSHD